MKTLASTLVHATVYIKRRSEQGPEADEWGVGPLEMIRAMLEGATEEEKDALAEAAEEAAALQLPASNGSDEGYLSYADFAGFMEEIFRAGWKGNRRAAGT